MLGWTEEDPSQQKGPEELCSEEQFPILASLAIFNLLLTVSQKTSDKLDTQKSWII